MRARTPTMDAGLLGQTRSVTRLDYGFLQKLFLVFGLICIVISPLTKDFVAFAVGGFMPYLLMRIVGRPNMPVAIVYLVLWQWGQAFARAIQTLPDGEALGSGLFGPNIERAYWYVLASVLVLAVTMRAVLGNLPEPTPQSRQAHSRWEARDLVILYVVTLLLSIGARYLGSRVSALDQPLQALLHAKVLALFLLFTYVMTTGKGGKFMLLIVLFETVSGFTGLLSDFRAVFLQLAMAAVAVRIRWTATMGIAAVVWLAVLSALAIFWSGVKADYRQVAIGGEESQQIRASLGDRLQYLGDRAINPDKIDWNEATYALLVRFAYVDIFGSVITVQDASPERVILRQWSDAISHVLQPRFLFPDKAALSDTEVYVRLAKGDPTEEIRGGTSISVGYMAENYADLGFPGMLAGIFVIGLVTAVSYRYFLTRRLPWMVREGTVLVLVYAIGRDGVEISLPKMVGAIIVVTAVYVVLARFVYPYVLRWLDGAASSRGASVPVRLRR